MSKWIAEFELEDGDTMPEHMDLNYMGAKIDFHCRPMWIPVSERLPETDNENTINSFNVLLWVANKKHPEREAQIYLGKLRRVDGDDGSGNFWGIETKPCEWTIWGWSYFNEPEVIAWMPLPEPYKAESEADKEKLSWLGKNCKDCGNEKCKKLGALPRGYDCALWQAESED